jgi:hypothetical protein
VIRFRLRSKGTIVLVVRNSHCSVVGRRRYPGRPGINRVRFDGRIHGRPLKPGKYSIDLVVVRGSRRMQVGAIAVEVVPPGRHLTRAQRSATLTSDCVAVLTAPPLPVPVLATTAPTGGTAAPPTPEHNDAKKPSKTGVLGVSLKPPRLPVPVVHNAPTWLGILLVGLFGLSVAALAVYVTRFVRGSWNP